MNLRVRRVTGVSASAIFAIVVDVVCWEYRQFGWQSWAGKKKTKEVRKDSRLHTNGELEWESGTHTQKFGLVGGLVWWEK